MIHTNILMMHIYEYFLLTLTHFLFVSIKYTLKTYFLYVHF